MHERPDSYRHAEPPAMLAATTSAAGPIAPTDLASAPRPATVSAAPPAPDVLAGRNSTHRRAAAPHPAKVAAEPTSGRARKPARIAPMIAPIDPAARTNPSEDPSRPGRASMASLARKGEGALTSTDAGKK